MYRRGLDEPAEGELAGLSRAAGKALTESMDAVVIIDPAEFQRRPGEPAGNLRTLPFGPNSQVLVTFLIDPPDDLVLVVKIQWIGD